MGGLYPPPVPRASQLVRSPGDWDPSTSYALNDLVRYGSTSYLCILANSVQQPPNTTYWKPLGVFGQVFNVKDYGASGSASQYTGSITSGQPTLTVDSAHDFEAGNGIVIRGAGASHTIPAPGAPAIGNAGTAGATTYTYRICSLTGDGGWSAIGAETSTTTGNAALGTTNCNNICWTQVSTGASGGNTGNHLGGFLIFGRTSGSDFPLATVNAAATNCRAVYFSSTGYTNAVPSDIGKNLTGGGSGYNGTLLSYDNTNRIWYILPATWTVDFFTASGKSLSISTGTGAGTTVTAPISGLGSDLAYYWQDKGDIENYAYRTYAWREYFEHVEGDWIFHPFNNTGKWYKAYKARTNHRTGATSPTLTSALGAVTLDGNVYWRREEPLWPTLAPASAEPNVLTTTVSSVSGTTVTLADNASNTVSSQQIYHDDLAACQAAHIAMSNSSTAANVYFPAGTYQFLTGTRSNDSRWTGYGFSSLNSTLFSVSTTVGNGMGWELDNECQIRVMSLGMNSWLSDTLVAGQTGTNYTLITFFSLQGWSFRGRSLTSRITWEPYGTPYADGQSGHNGYYLSDTYYGGNSQYSQNILWENLLIDGWTIVVVRQQSDPSGSQGEYFRNVFFSYGGGYHDNALFIQGAVTIDRCSFVSRRFYRSRAIYGPSYTQAIKGVASVDTGTYVLTSNSHGFVVGQPVQVRATPTAVFPSGTIAPNTTYYVGNTTTNTLNLYPTPTDAQNNTNPITITTTVTTGDISLVYQTVYPISVKDCYFDRAGSVGRYCIEVRSDDFTITGCTFKNCDPIVSLDGQYRMKILYCTFYNTGIQLSSSFQTISNNSFIDSSVTLNGYVTDSVIANNTFWSLNPGAVSNYILSLNSSTNARLNISNNVFNLKKSRGILVGGSEITIANNTFDYVTQNPIQVTSNGNGLFIIKDNTVNNHTNGFSIYAIDVSAATTATFDIKGNRILSGCGISAAGVNGRIIDNYCGDVYQSIACAGTGPWRIEGNICKGTTASTFTGGNTTLLDNAFTTLPSSLTGVIRSNGNTYPAGLDYISSTQADSTTYTPNAGVYHTHDVTLQGAVTIAAPTNGTIGDTIEIWLRQDATGGRVATLNAAYRVGSYTQNTTASKMDALTFRYDGTNWVLTGAETGL